jgi:hypothetical protein
MRQAVGVRVAVFAAAATAWGPGRPAFAQTGADTTGGPSARGPAYKPMPLNLQKQQIGSAGLPDLGRARMRGGDYDGALQAFDEALRSLTDPTIYRDRGLCHEQLGHVYPAIDDYRVYLTDSPEAPDAEGIARRLQVLEDQVSGHPSTASTNDDDTPADLGASAKVRVGSAHASASASTGGSSGSSSDTKGPRASDRLDYVAPDEDAVRTPLRRGKGVSLAPFFSVHKWFSGGAFSNVGDSQSWTESVGAQFRYAVASSGALVVEAGYEHFNTTSIDPAQVSGLTSLVGYELRFGFDPEFDNQIIVMPALGYEHLSVTFSDVTLSSQAQSIGAFVPRLRVGWRHMLQTSTALDLSLDAGAGSFFTYDKFPLDSSQSASGLLALSVSIAWGL